MLKHAGVVLSDPKKLLKKNSPLVQMWELFAGKQFLPAAKMGDQVLKKIKNATVPSQRAFICSLQAGCYRELRKFTKALPKAEQATEEDPNLACAWSALAEAQRNVARWDEAIVNAEKAIACTRLPRRLRATA